MKKGFMTVICSALLLVLLSMLSISAPAVAQSDPVLTSHNKAQPSAFTTNLLGTDHVGSLSYGTEMWILKTSPVPAGWVITYETRDKFKILNAAGAASGVELWVLHISPIPAGWVITFETPYKYKIVNVAGAASGTEIWVVHASPIPAGWVIVAELNGKYKIRYI
ncbi:hypothetical protein [Paenibacillus sp. 481]|uniref:hypothetical protein n=1 Tax=Paenibacillus sp. 481 TaxID=2835869 RepID=UPI001E4A4D56|nr:hypothetical protein [Paenibacillus sp. 481]UHA72479.1 hypothetical protein KIK04_17660 [Paenibacillus sp. 481]